MNTDVTVTLAGFVGTTPKLFTSASGNDYTSFRVAHTKRYYDRAQGEWLDGPTTWFTVKVWRGVARNVSASLRKGDPVVVTGRLAVDEWTGTEGPRTDLVVEATALGPDLTRGEANFRQVIHRRAAGEESPSETGPAVTSAEELDEPDPWAVAENTTPCADTPHEAMTA